MIEGKQGDPLRLTIDQIKTAKPVLCDCGGAIFSEKLMFRRISPIISPTGKEETYPMNVVVCNKCGKVPSGFNPYDLVPKEFLAKKPGIVE
jgi:hypothetical protein